MESLELALHARALGPSGALLDELRLAGSGKKNTLLYIFSLFRVSTLALARRQARLHIGFRV